MPQPISLQTYLNFSKCRHDYTSDYYISAFTHQLSLEGDLQLETDPYIKDGKIVGDKNFTVYKLSESGPVPEMHNIIILISVDHSHAFVPDHVVFNEWTSVTKPLKTRTMHKKLLHFVDLYPKDITNAHLC